MRIQALMVNVSIEKKNYKEKLKLVLWTALNSSDQFDADEWSNLY